MYCTGITLKLYRGTTPWHEPLRKITKLNEAETFLLVIGERMDLGPDSYHGQEFNRWWKAVHPNR